MNYKQALIHEALQELRHEQPELLAHVTDVNSAWETRENGIPIILVFKGTAFFIRMYNGLSFRYDHLSIWGCKKEVETDPETRKAYIADIKNHIVSTIKHAQKTLFDNSTAVYPGLVL